MLLRLVLLSLHPLQPGDLALQPGDLLLRGFLLLGVLLVRGIFRLGQVVELDLAFLILLPEPLHLSLQPADDLRIRLRALRNTCSRHEVS